jgi:hypothetical protein
MTQRNDPIPVTLQDIESALDGGRLWVAMANGNWWKARRNGATKLWKTRPADFQIPIKAGLRATGRISETDAATSFPSCYLISAIDPNGARKGGK